MNLSTLLKLLPVVGPVISATSEFRKLYEEAALLLHPTDQATLKDALAIATSEADDAHAELARIVAQNS